MITAPDSHRVAPESLLCNSALPATSLLASSRDGEWSSLLVDHSRSAGICEPYGTLATPDHTIVIVTRGEVEVESHQGGLWRKSVYGAGTAGRTEAFRSDRLRWRLPRATDLFEKVHVFVPQPYFREAADHLRRPGAPDPENPNFSMTFTDGFVAQSALALLTATRAGAPDLYAQVMARSLVTHLLSFHSPYGAPDDARSPGLVSDRRIARAIDFMSAHLAQPLSLEALASEAGISKFHFARLFRQRTGLGPVHYLTRLRMETAQRLLSRSEMLIVEVAAICGYPSAAHFSMAFRRHFGVSPRQERRAGPIGFAGLEHRMG